MTAPASQQVSWWSVHEFVTELVKQANVGPLPPAGTPAWCAMTAGDPRKLLSLAIAGEHHALRVETAQMGRAEASRAVSVAADWPAVSQEMAQLNSFRKANPWAKRVVG